MTANLIFRTPENRELVGMILRLVVPRSRFRVPRSVPGSGFRVPVPRSCTLNQNGEPGTRNRERRGIDITSTLWNIQAYVVCPRRVRAARVARRPAPRAGRRTAPRSGARLRRAPIASCRSAPSTRRCSGWNRRGSCGRRIGEPLPERGGRRRKYVELLPAGARALKVAYNAFADMAAGVEQRLKAL